MYVAVDLFYKMLVGLILGTLAGDSSDPDDRNTRVTQTACLVAVSSCFLMYLICVRPYYIPLANFFEALARNTFSDRTRCIAQLRPRSLIPAECSAVR